MLQNKNQAAYRLGAVFYVLWGLLHIIAAVRAYQLGAAQEPGMVQGKLYQNPGTWATWLSFPSL
jgi:hypothetical protein